MAAKLVRSCFCYPQEWEKNNYDNNDLDGVANLEAIKVFLVGPSLGRDWLNLTRKCVSCIMPPTSSFCKVICKKFFVHKDLCTC